ncbi:MAG: hypothetical protein ABI725_02840 [Chloroflexota bacterium]
MSPEVASALMFVLGVGLLYAALLIRRGWRRWWVLRYRDYRLPLLYRNGAFPLAPSGVALISTSLLTVASAHRQETWALVVMALASAAGVISFVTAVAWTYSPPQIAKPPWLRQEEARLGLPVDPNPRARLFERLWIASIFAPLVLALVVVVVKGTAWLISQFN